MGESAPLRGHVEARDLTEYKTDLIREEYRALRASEYLGSVYGRFCAGPGVCGERGYRDRGPALLRAGRCSAGRQT